MSNVTDIVRCGFSLDVIDRMTEAELALWADTVQFKDIETSILEQMEQVSSSPFADPKGIEKAHNKLKSLHSRLINWYLGKPDEGTKIIEAVYGPDAIRS